jgi:putative thiamine transport system permease protein
VQRLSAAWLIDGRRSSGDGKLAAAGFAGMAVVAAVSLIGLVGLALWSVAGDWRFPAAMPSSLTLAHWLGQWPALAGPLVTTVAVGLVATSIALVAVIAALENELRLGRRAGRVAMALIYLPLVVPPVAFLFGLAVAAQLAGATGGFWPVAFGHVVFVLPYVYLSLSESYHRLDPRWTSVAQTLGASAWRTFIAVRLPILLAPCLTAAAVGFSVSIGQYLATQLLGAGRVPTITTEAVALSTGGDRRIIGVWALMQAVLPALAFAVAIAAPRLLWRRRAGLRGAR